MSKASQLKGKWDYEADIARCETCTHYRIARVVLSKDSQTKRIHQHCNLGGFNVGAMSICNRWTGKAGEMLA